MKPGQAASIAFACLLFPLAVSAQDKTESVTVTGQTPQTRTEVMRGFVRSTAAPSPLTGKLARWDNPICPLIIGLKPEENLAVRERIKRTPSLWGRRYRQTRPATRIWLSPLRCTLRT